MPQSKSGVSFWLILIFSVVSVSAKDIIRDDNLNEMGLNPTCVSQVLAMCSTSTPSPTFHTHVDKNCCSAETDGLVEALKDSTSSNKAVLQLLKEWLGTNAMQEKFLHGIKNDVESVKEIVSQSVSDIQALNKALQETNFNIFNEWKKNRAMDRNILENMNVQTAMETTLSKIQQVMTDIQQDFSEIKEIFEKPEFTVPKKYKSLPHNCAELFKSGSKESGVQIVFPFACCKNMSISVYCDQTTDGGGWTVFQRRDVLPQREDFFRTWEYYQRGFGNLTGEFWLGLDNIHALVSSEPMELRVDLEDFEGEKQWAKYDTFSIDDAAGQYRLHIGNYSGNAGDSMKYHNRSKFSTKDNDNDATFADCAERSTGAWWYNACFFANLNGYPHEGKHDTDIDDGIAWFHFRGSHYSLMKTTMKIRPVSKRNLE